MKGTARTKGGDRPWRRLWIFPIFLVLLVLAARPASADIEGKPDILDGMTLRFAGQDIRLFGITAPARDETCPWGRETFPCGFNALNALNYMTAFQWVRCRPVPGAAAAGGAIVARCFLGGRYDLGERMVRSGWAVTDRDVAPEYVAAEEAAKAEGLGIWARAQ